MPRLFDGTDDRIGFPVTVGTLTALSIVAVVRLGSEANSVKTIFGAGDSNVPRFTMQIGGAELLALSVNGTARNSTTTILIADGWVFAAVTKAAGTSTGRAHIQKYAAGSAMVHENLSSTSVDPGGTPAVGQQIGAANATTPTAFYNGDIAIVAVYGSALSDAQLEAMAYSLPAWWQASPVGLWVLDQNAVTQNVEDVTGLGANQSAITGTAVTTAAVPFGYGHPVTLVERTYAAATTATAGVATVTAAGVGANDAVLANAGQATVTAAGLSATVQVAKAVDAGQAQVAAAALGVTGTVVANLGLASATAAGRAASNDVKPWAGQAQVTAAGLDATVATATFTTATATTAEVAAAGLGLTASVVTNLGQAAVSAAGLGALPVIAAVSGVASSAAAGLGVTGSVVTNATIATVAAAGQDAAASTAAEATALADNAAATATGLGASVAVAATAGVAASVAAGVGATVETNTDQSVTATTAEAIAVAWGATAGIVSAGVDGGRRALPRYPVTLPDTEDEDIAVLLTVLRDVQPFG